MWIPVVAVLALLCVMVAITQGGQSVAAGGSQTITAYTQPWCGACKRLQPEWDRLTAMAAPELTAIKVDCSTDDCSAIQKYPTIVCGGQEYTGQRTAEAMKAWALSLPS